MEIGKMSTKVLLAAGVVALSAGTAGIGAIGARALLNGAKKGVDEAYSEKLQAQELDELQNKDPEIGQQLNTIG